jgi:hypothetical protein
MNLKEEILGKFVEFQQFLDGINMEELKLIPRNELISFQKQLYEVKHVSLAYEIGKIIEEKKKAEFPQILGVHHYPELNEITFLSEEVKLQIDNHLLGFRIGNYLNSFYRFVSDSNKVKLLEDFLVEKEIVEELFIVKCPHCSKGHLTKGITKEMLETLKQRIQSISKDDEDGSYDILEDEGLLESYCSNCEDHVDLSLLKNENRFSTSRVLKMAKKRDETYDNV